MTDNTIRDQFTEIEENPNGIESQFFKDPKSGLDIGYSYDISKNLVTAEDDLYDSGFDNNLTKTQWENIWTNDILPVAKNPTEAKIEDLNTNLGSNANISQAVAQTLLDTYYTRLDQTIIQQLKNIGLTEAQVETLEANPYAWATVQDLVYDANGAIGKKEVPNLNNDLPSAIATGNWGKVAYDIGFNLRTDVPNRREDESLLMLGFDAAGFGENNRTSLTPLSSNSVDNASVISYEQAVALGSIQPFSNTQTAVNSYLAVQGYYVPQSSNETWSSIAAKNLNGISISALTLQQINSALPGSSLKKGGLVYVPIAEVPVSASSPYVVPSQSFANPNVAYVVDNGVTYVVGAIPSTLNGQSTISNNRDVYVVNANGNSFVLDPVATTITTDSNGDTVLTTSSDKFTVSDSSDNNKVEAGGVTTTIRNLEYVSYDTNGNIVLNQDSDTETPEAGSSAVTVTYTVGTTTTTETINAVQNDLTTDDLNFEGQSISGNFSNGQMDQYGRTYNLSGDTLTITGSTSGDTLAISNFHSGNFAVNVGYTFSPFVGPYSHSEPVGINDSGVIIGVGFNADNSSDGFIDDHGTFTQLGTGIYVSAISNNGLMTIRDSHNNYIDDHGVLTVIPLPPNSYGFSAAGINNNGEVVGTAFSDTNLGGGQQSWLYSNGTYTFISDPKASYTDKHGTFHNLTNVTGINDDGTVVGWYWNQGYYGFVYKDGVYTTFTAPNNGSLLDTSGINNNDQIAGSALDPITHARRAFIYDFDSGEYTPLDLPGVNNNTAVYISGINDSGEVVGYSGVNNDTSQPYLASDFIGTPPGHFQAQDNGTASVALGSDEQVRGSGNTVTLTGSNTVTVEGNGNTITTSAGGNDILIDGDSNVVTAYAGDTVTVTGNGQISNTANYNTVSLSSGTLTVDDAASLAFSGSGNTVVLGDDDDITITGTGNTISIGEGDVVTLSGNNTISGATDAGAALSTDTIIFDGVDIAADITLGAGGTSGSYTLSGATLTISFGGDVLTITNFSNGDFGVNVSYDETVSNGTVAVASNAIATISGDNDTITAGDGDMLAVNGGHETVTLTGTNTSLSESGWGSNTITLGGDTDTATIDGSNSTITLTGYADAVVINGAGNETVDLTGTNESLTETGWGSNTITLGGDTDTATIGGSNSAITLSGYADAVTINGAGNETVHLTGTNESLNESGWGSNAITLAGDTDTATIGGSNSAITLSGYADSVTINGAGNEIISLTGTNESLSESGWGSNTITLGGDSDTATIGGSYSTINLSGYAASATINGAGNETINLTGTNASLTDAGYGNDTITLGGDTNTATLSGSNSTITLTGYGDSVTMAAGRNETIHLNGNNETVYDSGSNSTITNSGTGNVLRLGAGIGIDQIWFEQSGNNLILDLLGTNNHITVDNWFGSSASPLSEIKTSSGSMIDNQLASLVQAMATFATDNPGFNPTTATIMPTDSVLQNTLAASWHS